MNRGHYKWIAIAFLVLGVLRFAHSMHWIQGSHASLPRFGQLNGESGVAVALLPWEHPYSR